MARIIRNAMIALITAIAILFLGDWAVWRARVAMGSGMGTISVSRMQVAKLKGNKEEYYYEGTADADCSRSIFPQAGSGACWWLARNKVIFDR